MSESDIVGKIKDLMPYLMAAVIFICITVLLYGDKISTDVFLNILMLLIGYVFGDVTGLIRLRRFKKLLHEMETPK